MSEKLVVKVLINLQEYTHLKRIEKLYSEGHRQENPSVAKGGGFSAQVSTLHEEELRDKAEGIVNERAKNDKPPTFDDKDQYNPDQLSSNNIIEKSTTEPLRPVSPTLSEELISSVVRKRYQKAAKSLLLQLKDHKNLISWDTNGVVTFGTQSSSSAGGVSIFLLIKVRRAFAMLY